MARYGLLIDYEYCTGCHTCEIACQMAAPNPGRKVGHPDWPKNWSWQIEGDKWQYAYIHRCQRSCAICAASA